MSAPRVHASTGPEIPTKVGRIARVTADPEVAARLARTYDQPEKDVIRRRAPRRSVGRSSPVKIELKNAYVTAPNGAVVKTTPETRKQLFLLDAADSRHGTITGYRLTCRCARCKAADSEHRAARRK